jgi:NADH-quinone oxidoreductase subunit F
MDRPLTQHVDLASPMNLKAYARAGGYQAARQALTGMAPGEVVALVRESGLRGRGGAGFPTGVKWGFVPPLGKVPHPRYLVANADEMEPGTFKDRHLMEGCPHQLVEAMIIAAYAISADRATIFLRWAYKRAARLLTEAISEAYQAGALGDDIMGSGYSLDLNLHVSAGRYICGEETALLNALEGRRATPRNKPPFPPVAGLRGRPTIVQNIETLYNIPPIVSRGAAWYRDLGAGEAAGTKLYGVSGRVNRPGLWELPLGTSLGTLLVEHAGGMQQGYSFRAAIPGGASTAFLVEDHLQVPLDFDSVAAAGSRLGTGTAVVLDDTTCPVGFVHNLIHFFAQESCGFCTPCRDGLSWVERTLAALEAGEGREEDLEILGDHAGLLGAGNTFCPLAPGAADPLASALKHFTEDFRRHIAEKRCPWR